jgi:predicted nucleic acid-binding protein
MNPVLVDTSSWIHMLRADGNANVRARVEAVLEAGTACWCPIIRLEVWNGAGERDRKTLLDFERNLPELPIIADVWNLACGIAQKARKVGVTVPASDVLIAACARFHNASLEHADPDFDRLPD